MGGKLRFKKKKKIQEHFLYTGEVVGLQQSRVYIQYNVCVCVCMML